MKKIWLIIQREYLSRVKKKSFLVTTILVPVLMFGAITGMVYVAMSSEQDQKIVIRDHTGQFAHQLDSSREHYKLIYSEPTLHNWSGDSLLKKYDADILVDIVGKASQKPDSVVILKEGGVSLAVKEFISSEVDELYQTHLMQEAGIQPSSIDSIRSQKLSIKSYDLKEKKETSAEMASAVGYIMGFLIYLVLFIYGAGVMRGVMEEKTNRIAEVIISSVKPFQLMMGKIVGIALVGLTQFLIWGIIMIALQFLLPVLIPSLAEINPSHLSEIQQGAKDIQQINQIQGNDKLDFLLALTNQNWGFILFSFLFYFLGGYFLYASMFAAVGSLVNEDPQEAQQLTLPVTMPIIFGFIIMAATANDPHSSLAVFGSLFPLTSPIVMLARIPYDPPTWQILTSMALLVLGFILMTWLSAKIYRTGILMYGKKITWKEVIKWMRYK